MERQSKKICCVVSRGELPEDKLELVRQKLLEEVLQAVADGFTVFLNGYTTGADLELAKIVADLRDGEYPKLFLEAVLPYAGCMEFRSRPLLEMLPRCDGIRAANEEYSEDCDFLRDRDMVIHSERVIAVADGQTGEPVSTINYAMTMEKDIRIINI